MRIHFFRCWTHLYMSLFPSIRLSVHPSNVHNISGIVHHVIIIFGTHVLNDNISKHFLKFLINFDFLSYLGARAKNSPKWKQKLHLSVTSHFSFFHFFKILIFWVVRRVIGQKTVQNDKKFCLLRSISQKSYIIWLSFMLHMCKMIIPPVVFSFLQNFNFWDCYGR